jgi:hypothetical protein
LAAETGTPGRVTIRPHRSHRTLRVSRGSWIGSIVTLPLGLLVAYGILVTLWPRATDWISSLLVGNTAVSALVKDNFLWIPSTVPVPNLPPLSILGALSLAGVCAVVVVIGGFLKQNAPLPLWIQANLIVLMLTALWAFFEGRVAYDGPTFMLLLERTSVIMILCSPIFAVVVSALLPFSALERASMFVLLISLCFTMSLLRLAAFALILGHVGVIAEANLYLFFGPLIDVVYFILVYSICVVSLSRRIAKDEEAWEWL